MKYYCTSTQTENNIILEFRSAYIFLATNFYGNLINVRLIAIDLSTAFILLCYIAIYGYIICI